MSWIRRPQPSPEWSLITQTVKEAEERWVDYFDTALHSMLDYEMRGEEIQSAVEKSAQAADIALGEFEKRWRKAQ